MGRRFQVCRWTLCGRITSESTEGAASECQDAPSAYDMRVCKYSSKDVLPPRRAGSSNAVLDTWFVINVPGIPCKHHAAVDG
jgi:hypothetical protein